LKLKKAAFTGGRNLLVQQARTSSAFPTRLGEPCTKEAGAKDISLIIPSILVQRLQKAILQILQTYL